MRWATPGRARPTRSRATPASATSSHRARRRPRSTAWSWPQTPSGPRLRIPHPPWSPAPCRPTRMRWPRSHPSPRPPA
ncbi:MAG: hypothetical protein EON88_30450 [Brevundimonas sp.]|nr:MAG: hypothetical protein EON88_30450 [Brevundimonas sp.]